MLMADEVEWPGQEVEMLFGDSDWFENSDWDKDPSPLVWHTATKIPLMYSISGNSAASAPISTFMCL